jgi:hypothetical protein
VHAEPAGDRLMRVLNVETRFQAGVQATLKGRLTE